MRATLLHAGCMPKSACTYSLSLFTASPCHHRYNDFVSLFAAHGVNQGPCSAGKKQQRLCSAFYFLTHGSFAEEGSRESVDAKCRRLTATWVRERHVSDHDIEVCDFFEQLERAGAASRPS